MKKITFEDYKKEYLLKVLKIFKNVYRENKIKATRKHIKKEGN